MCSEAPDMSGANAAAVMQADLSAEQLKWFKELEASSKPMREAAAKKASAVSDAQLESMKLQDSLTREGADHYRSTFKPIEAKIAGDALAYDTPERRTAEAGLAMAGVGSQADIARLGLRRDLESRGVDANSGNSAIALTRSAIAEAAAKAAAGNAASRQVETIGAAKMNDAAGLGRGIVSSQGTTAGIALNAGNASVGNAGAALGAATSGAGLMQAGYSGAQQGLAGAANTHLGIAKMEAGDGGAGAAAGIGSAVGGIAMAI